MEGPLHGTGVTHTCTHPLTTLSFSVLGSCQHCRTLIPSLHQELQVLSFLETSFLDCISQPYRTCGFVYVFFLTPPKLQHLAKDFSFEALLVSEK